MRGRAYRRAQNKRVAESRRKKYLDRMQGKPWHTDLDDGFFVNEQPHLGCRKAGCTMCHPHKHVPKARANSLRAALDYESAAS